MKCTQPDQQEPAPGKPRRQMPWGNIVIWSVVAVLAVAAYHKYTATHSGDPLANTGPSHLGAYCDHTTAPGVWAEADVTAHAGHKVRLTVTGADGQTRAATVPDGEGWLTAGPLPAADERRPVHAVVTVDGRKVREDTLIPYSCGTT